MNVDEISGDRIDKKKGSGVVAMRAAKSITGRLPLDLGAT
jgi:hypothetical protein